VLINAIKVIINKMVNARLLVYLHMLIQLTNKAMYAMINAYTMFNKTKCIVLANVQDNNIMYMIKLENIANKEDAHKDT